MKSMVGKEFWDNDWEAVQNRKFGTKFGDYRQFFGHYILRRFLRHDSTLSFLEIGCVPGKFMVYFAKEFGYKVTGLDYSDAIGLVEANLKAHDLKDFELFHMDLFEMPTVKKYDIVFSAGFVEHFTDIDLVFKKHCDLLAPNGCLIISLPNFQYIQKFLRILFGDRNFFKTHNLDVMFPQVWRNLAEKENLSIQYCDYCLTFQFWVPATHNKLIRLLTGGGSYITYNLLRIFHLHHIPNRYFSPHILLIAKKLSN